MIPYILHVTVIITVCFLFYKLLLQKETFYQLNRWTLLTCLAVSFALPFLPVPQGLSWTRLPHLAVIDPPVAAPATTAAIKPALKPWANISASNPAEPLHVTRPKRTTVSASTKTNEPLTANLKIPIYPTDQPATTSTYYPVLSAPAIQPRQTTGTTAPSTLPAPATLLLILHLLFYGYLLGVVLFGINFLLQIAVLYYQSHANPVIRDGRFRIVETSGNRAPCSFANNIFINPALYDPETYQQILLHEKIHVSGRHTLDILLAELAVVLQWFNPFVWLYRREVENNLEFLTDQSVLLHRDVERSAYQLSLLRVSAPHLPFSITNNYNQSLLKRRIVMMNSKRSSANTIWKYFFLIPLFMGLGFALNKPAVLGAPKSDHLAAAGKVAAAPGPGNEAAAQMSRQKWPALSPATISPASDTTARRASSGSGSPAGKNSSSGEEGSHAREPQPSEQPSQQLNQVTASVAQVNMLTPPDINPVFREDSDLADGAWFATTTDNKLSFELKAESEERSWNSTLRVEKSEINPFPGQGSVEFKLTRDAGTMSFKGQFDGQEGFGHFHYIANESYFTDLRQMGVEMDENRTRMAFFTLNIKKEYADMVVHNGYPHISERDLISFAAMHIDKDFIQYWHGSGFDNADNPRNLISLKAMKVDRAYVDDLKAAGYDHLEVHELMSLKAQHIDGAYIRSLGRGKNNEPIPIHELVSYKAMHIDSGYLVALRKLGYDDLQRHEVTSLYSMHVTPEYIQSLQDLGYKNIPVHDLTSLKAMQVTPEYIKGFRDIGYKDLDIRQLSILKGMHITPEYVKEFMAIGYKDLDARQLTGFRSTDITPEFIKGFRDLGYEDLDPNQLRSLKAIGITPDFVKEFNKIGFDHIPVNTLTLLKAMGVDAAYITKMKEKGFNSQDLRKYVRLKQDFDNRQ
jgi:hypothetical protein